MRGLWQVLMTLLGAIVCFLALCIFLIGVPLLVNRGLSASAAVTGMLLYTTLALAVAFCGWRILAAARKISVA